jgi:hypothetical protein
MKAQFSRLVILAQIILIGTTAHAQLVTPDPSAPITGPRKRAALIYQRLTGVKVGIDAPILAQMEERLNNSDPLGAAALVTGSSATDGDPNFYDITVQQMAAKMSTREETIKAPLSDFVATVIGIVRDDRNARDLLQGNYFYAGRQQFTPNNQNVIQNILRSNTHYEQLDRAPASLRDAIEPTPRTQLIAANDASAVTNPDAAGVLTSRAFTQAHAIAGTNRRMLQYTFKQFLCVDMEAWATTDSPDNRVGPDIERAPGGDPATFQKTCKGCHGNMDGMRSAFANLDFGNNQLKHGLVMTNQNNNGINADGVGANNFARGIFNNVTYQGVASKYIRNAGNAPGGYFVTDASWINTATKGSNALYFGWRSMKDENGYIKGFGVNQFGKMVSESEAFSRCMVRRVYQQVCKRDTAISESEVVRELATVFERDGLNFRRLFQRVATHEACIGR